ncbi:MAG: PLP-dependent aminotransferase family protein [Monoglobales bacterium]
MKSKKYLSVYHDIKSKIICGEFKAGEKLPSKRIMADRSGCSVITVEKAYNMLADEGYIEPKERSGYFVCKLDIFNAGGGTENERAIKYLEEKNTASKNIDFEYSVWFKTIRKVIAENGEKLFLKSPNKGCETLRNAIAGYLLRYRGMLAQPERIIIGSGAEQLYEIVVRVLGRDKIYGIEDPSYKQIEAVYRVEGAQIEKLKMGTDGIKSSALKNSSIDVLHVTPFKSYPTGVTTSALKRYEYLKWAGGTRYIVEDDFNSEFFSPGQPIESLYSMGGGKSVIYINTFSKSLSPSMRMGYMILPEELNELYDKKLGQFSCSVPVLDQYILAEFIRSGNFERHLNRMRRKIT